MLCAQGGYAGTFGDSEGGMSELLGAQGGVCRGFCGRRGRYAGNGVGSGGAMPELLWARAGYAGTIVGLGGGVCRDLLWA